MLKKIIYQALIILAVGIVIAVLSTFFHQSANSLLFDADFNSEKDIIEIEDAKRLVIANKAIWIDTRPKRFYEEGHIPGAINIPLPGPINYRRQIFEKWEKDRLIINYCSNISCPIAKHLTTEMKFIGFTHVKVFEGGYEEWESAGLPLEKSRIEDGN